MDLDSHSIIDDNDVLFDLEWDLNETIPKQQSIDDDYLLNFDEILEPRYASGIENPYNYVQEAPKQNQNVLFCNDMSQLTFLQNSFAMNNIPVIIVNVPQQNCEIQQQNANFAKSQISSLTISDDFAEMSLSQEYSPQHPMQSKTQESLQGAEHLVKKMKLEEQFGTLFKSSSSEKSLLVKEEPTESFQVDDSCEDVVFIGENHKSQINRSRTMTGISSKIGESNTKRRVTKMKRSQTLGNMSSPMPSNFLMYSPATPMTPEDWAGPRTEYRYLVNMGNKRRKNKRSAPEDAFISKFSLRN